jgi:hypothetical protein
VKRTLLLLAWLLAAAASPAVGSDPNSSTARVVDIQDYSMDRTIQTGRANYLGVFLITLQDGQNEINVLYRYALFQHDFTKEIHAGMDIPYRLDGKHVYFKSQDGKDVKAALCEEKGDKLHCADMIFEPRKPRN